MRVKRTRVVAVPAPRKRMVLRRKLIPKTLEHRLLGDSYPGFAGAHLSDDGVYRYALWRRWDEGKMLVFVMLNPSTADASKDDPTLKRCIGFAKSLGYPGVLVVNLFAFRATDPNRLLLAMDPVGPANRAALEGAVKHATTGGPGHVILGWGAHVRRMRGHAHGSLHTLNARSNTYYCLERTLSGSPAHPLYLRKESKPKLFELTAYDVLWESPQPIEVVDEYDGSDAPPSEGLL